MAAIRKETLDILKDELTTPSTFLKQMLTSSKTGMVSLNIVQQMSKELCKIPLDYLVHCLSKERQGFAYDAVENKVCLDSQLKTQVTKTTPYGTIDPEEEEEQEEQQEEDAEQTRIYPEYKTPFFRPMFRIAQKVFPIFFDNDGFYVDDLPEKQVNAEKPNMDVPEHDVCSIEPLTNHERPKVVLHSGSVECFNCGANDHIFSQCPEPTNVQRINRKKRELLKKNQGRLHQQLEIQSKRDAFIPGKLSTTLRDALGMSEGQEPPYYHNMRIHGYPPAYIIDADPSKPTPTFYSVYQQPFDDDEYEELKIYDDSYDDSLVEQGEKHNEPKQTVQIKLIDYGTDFSLGVDTSKLDAAIQQYQSTNNNNVYPTEYPNQNTTDYYNNYYYDYYSAYYDYSGYEQYGTAAAAPPPPPGCSSESTGTAFISPPPPPPPPPSQNNKDVSNTQAQPNTHDDNDSVDMDISDDDDDDGL